MIYGIANSMHDNLKLEKNAVMNQTSMRAFDTNVGQLLPPTQALSS
jgi:hypothetical protein